MTAPLAKAATPWLMMSWLDADDEAAFEDDAGDDADASPQLGVQASWSCTCGVWGVCGVPLPILPPGVILVPVVPAYALAGLYGAAPRSGLLPSAPGVAAMAASLRE